MHDMSLPVFRQILQHDLLLFVQVDFFWRVQVVYIMNVDSLEKGVLYDVVYVLAA